MFSHVPSFYIHISVPEKLIGEWDIGLSSSIAGPHKNVSGRGTLIVHVTARRNDEAVSQNSLYSKTNMKYGGTVYIMASPDKTTLYTGVTSDLFNRVWEHKNKFYPNSFTAKYNCVVLVYYKEFERIELAIAEEKRIKGGSRQKKLNLINQMNYEWKDLSEEFYKKS